MWSHQTAEGKIASAAIFTVIGQIISIGPVQLAGHKWNATWLNLLIGIHLLFVVVVASILYNTSTVSGRAIGLSHQMKIFSPIARTGTQTLALKRR
jgi:hypothetical protein